MTWIIDKTFEFCYGHRVWTQKLNGEYAADLKCACRHLHGHEGKMQVFLTAPKLDKTGMVTDFRHLEWLKKWINTYIDHQFIIDKSDPLYGKIIGDRGLVPVLVPDTDFVAGWHLGATGRGDPRSLCAPPHVDSGRSTRGLGVDARGAVLTCRAYPSRWV